MQLINKKDLYGDGIGYVEQHDFSKANMSYESRVEAVTTVASVCYANPKALGSVKLYDRLSTENKGLPSSSYEFVPVLLSIPRVEELLSRQDVESIADLLCDNNDWNIIKYGELVELDRPGNTHYLLTNLRALIADVGDRADQFYNTEEECEIIAKHFKVFKSKIPLFIRAQYIRHRTSWQELSRRYVSGKKQELEFYIAPKLHNLESTSYVDEIKLYTLTEEIVDICVNHYNTSISAGVKPEVARSILPQSMYTTLYSAWMPNQLDVFFKLRLDSHSQAEIRELAEAKKGLLDGTN